MNRRRTLAMTLAALAAGVPAGPKSVSSQTRATVLITAVVTIDGAVVAENGAVITPDMRGEWTVMIGDHPATHYAFGLLFRRRTGDVLDVLPHVVDPDGRVRTETVIRLGADWQAPGRIDLPLTEVVLPGDGRVPATPRAALRLDLRRLD
jgi:hypothetical protein